MKSNKTDSSVILDKSNLETLKKGRPIWRRITGEGSSDWSLNFCYKLYTSSFFDSKTQSRRLMTTKGRITRPYSDGLNNPLRSSSAVDQIKDDIDEVDCKSLVLLLKII